MTSGIRNEPPISTSWPREVMTSRSFASAANAISVAPADGGEDREGVDGGILAGLQAAAEGVEHLVQTRGEELPSRLGDEGLRAGVGENRVDLGDLPEIGHGHTIPEVSAGSRRKL